MRTAELLGLDGEDFRRGVVAWLAGEGARVSLDETALLAERPAEERVADLLRVARKALEQPRSA